VGRPLIESVPNISEGRRPGVIREIAEAAVGAGCWLVDVASDADHNRSVITLVGTSRGLPPGLVRLCEAAVERIDLRTHQGAHPRMGAVDVVPLVPLGDATMQECVELSRALGQEIAARLNVPVILYEESASAPHRRNLAAVRKGQFERLGERLATPEWAPDYGPPAPHPSAGAVAVGARETLVAFNVNLRTDDLKIAQRIAVAVRGSGGGLRYVKALGVPLEERGEVQVSMNLTNVRKTPIHRVLEMVEREAERLGVAVSDCEIVGKVPRFALYDTAAATLRLRGFGAGAVLEECVEGAVNEDRGE